jgi:hypothetical protein
MVLPFLTEVLGMSNKSLLMQESALCTTSGKTALLFYYDPENQELYSFPLLYVTLVLYLIYYALLSTR